MIIITKTIFVKNLVFIKNNPLIIPFPATQLQAEIHRPAEEVPGIGGVGTRPRRDWAKVVR